MATWSIDYKVCRTASTTKSHLHLRIYCFLQSYLHLSISSLDYTLIHLFPCLTASGTKYHLHLRISWFHLHLSISWLDWSHCSHWFLHFTASGTKSHLHLRIYCFLQSYLHLSISSLDYTLIHLFPCLTASGTKYHLHLRISWFHLHLSISWLDWSHCSHWFLHFTASGTKSHLHLRISCLTFMYFLIELSTFLPFFASLCIRH